MSRFNMATPRFALEAPDLRRDHYLAPAQSPDQRYLRTLDTECGYGLRLTGADFNPMINGIGPDYIDTAGGRKARPESLFSQLLRKSDSSASDLFYGLLRRMIASESGIAEKTYDLGRIFSCDVPDDHPAFVMCVSDAQVGKSCDFFREILGGDPSLLPQVVAAMSSGLQALPPRTYPGAYLRVLVLLLEKGASVRLVAGLLTDVFHRIASNFWPSVLINGLQVLQALSAKGLDKNEVLIYLQRYLELRKVNGIEDKSSAILAVDLFFELAAPDALSSPNARAVLRKILASNSASYESYVRLKARTFSPTLAEVLAIDAHPLRFLIAKFQERTDAPARSYTGYALVDFLIETRLSTAEPQEFEDIVNLIYSNEINTRRLGHPYDAADAAADGFIGRGFIGRGLSTFFSQGKNIKDVVIILKSIAVYLRDNAGWAEALDYLARHKVFLLRQLPQDSSPEAVAKVSEAMRLYVDLVSDLGNRMLDAKAAGAVIPAEALDKLINLLKAPPSNYAYFETLVNLKKRALISSAQFQEIFQCHPDLPTAINALVVQALEVLARSDLEGQAELKKVAKLIYELINDSDALGHPSCREALEVLARSSFEIKAVQCSLKDLIMGHFAEFHPTEAQRVEPYTMILNGGAPSLYHFLNTHRDAQLVVGKDTGTIAHMRGVVAAAESRAKKNLAPLSTDNPSLSGRFARLFVAARAPVRAPDPTAEDSAIAGAGYKL